MSDLIMDKVHISTLDRGAHAHWTISQGLKKIY